MEWKNSADAVVNAQESLRVQIWFILLETDGSSMQKRAHLDFDTLHWQSLWDLQTKFGICHFLRLSGLESTFFGA